MNDIDQSEDVHAALERSNARIAQLEQRLRDGSEQVEAARQAARMKQQFIDVVSHELRTPLTPILGFARMLLRSKSDPLSEEQRPQVEVILESARRLHRAVESVLDFQALQGAGVELEPRDVDVRAFAETVRATAKRLVAPTRLTANVTVDEEVPETLHLDPRRLDQVVVRLLENAVKYTRRGTVDVRMRWVQSTDTFSISVRDTGVGIAEDRQRHVFDAFYQAEDPDTRAQPGLGLGLAHARQMAIAMGGDIYLKSVPGKGSVFTLVVPGHQVGLSREWSVADLTPPREDPGEGA